MTFCWCPATTSVEWKRISGGKDWFEMGSPTNEYGRGRDEMRHRVKLTKGFWMAQTPITQGQFRFVFGGEIRGQMTPKNSIDGRRSGRCHLFWYNNSSECSQTLSKRTEIK